MMHSTHALPIVSGNDQRYTSKIKRCRSYPSQDIDPSRGKVNTADKAASSAVSTIPEDTTPEKCVEIGDGMIDRIEDRIVSKYKCSTTTNDHRTLRRLVQCGICRTGYFSSYCAHSELLLSSCSCCGGPDHSLLTVTNLGSGEIALVCTCPLVDMSDFDHLSFSYSRAHKWLSPGKIAKECGYSTEAIEEMFKQIANKGCERHLRGGKLEQLQLDTKQICETERASWQFKRTLPCNLDSQDLYHEWLMEEQEESSE